MKMSHVNINDLPREALIQVFRFLDAVNLKNATLTCKQWNNIIESGCRWSVELFYDEYGQLCFKDPYSDEHKMYFILTTKRKFRTITIGGGRFSKDNRIFEMLQRHGNNVEELRLYGGRLDNLAALAELLSLTPNLKHAVIRMRFLRVASDVILDEDVPELKKLKNLEMCVSDHRIIKCFRKAKLAIIKIGEDGPSKHSDQLVDFLLSQEMLTSFTAEGGWTILVKMGKSNGPIPFRLTQLAISDSGGKSHNHDDLLRFIKSQAANLNELEIGWNIPNSVYESVFVGMSELNTLSVVIDEVPRDHDFYKGLKKNCSVRVLKLLDYRKDDMRDVGNFLKKLPNIRTLILPDTGYVNTNTLVEMAQNLSQFVSLFITSIDVYEHSTNYVKFTNLQTLHIQQLRVKINWNKFTKIHSRLAEITIETMIKSCFTCDDVKQIATNVDLQIVRLGVGFVADERFLVIIRSMCRNLKVLELHRSCISHRLSQCVEMNTLRFCDKIKRSTHFLLPLFEF